VDNHRVFHSFTSIANPPAGKDFEVFRQGDPSLDEEQSLCQGQPGLDIHNSVDYNSYYYPHYGGAP
jgi:hypothetical protein